MSPAENNAARADEADPAPLAERDLTGITLHMSGAQSAKTIKEGFEEKNTHWHEIVNKIDLARAYREMGDKDAAGQILQEVIQEGDARQQESARLMLANL